MTTADDGIYFAGVKLHKLQRQHYHHIRLRRTRRLSLLVPAIQTSRTTPSQPRAQRTRRLSRYVSQIQTQSEQHHITSNANGRGVYLFSSSNSNISNNTITTSAQADTASISIRPAIQNPYGQQNIHGKHNIIRRLHLLIHLKQHHRRLDYCGTKFSVLSAKCIHNQQLHKHELHSIAKHQTSTTQPPGSTTATTLPMSSGSRQTHLRKAR